MNSNQAVRSRAVRGSVGCFGSTAELRRARLSFGTIRGAEGALPGWAPEITPVLDRGRYPQRAPAHPPAKKTGTDRSCSRTTTWAGEGEDPDRATAPPVSENSSLLAGIPASVVVLSPWELIAPSFRAGFQCPRQDASQAPCRRRTRSRALQEPLLASLCRRVDAGADPSSARRWRGSRREPSRALHG